LLILAATMGGLTFQKGLGAVHQISHPLGGLPPRRAPQSARPNGWGHGLHHGTLNAILLPHVLRFNFEACAGKMEAMSGVVGCGGGGELPGYFERLAGAAGLPARLRDVGVAVEECAGVLDGVMRDHCGATNPRPVTRADAARLLELAW
jgi:alcohol dehydrogenase class IV